MIDLDVSPWFQESRKAWLGKSIRIHLEVYNCRTSERQRRFSFGSKSGGLNEEIQRISLRYGQAALRTAVQDISPGSPELSDVTVT